MSTTTTGVPVDAPAVVQLTAYRVIQEALTNAQRHGRGSAALAMTWTTGELTIEVDNQIPPAGSTATSGSRLGLVGMAERVAAVGGTLDVGPATDTFHLRAALPFPTAEAP